MYSFMLWSSLFLGDTKHTKSMPIYIIWVCLCFYFKQVINSGTSPVNMQEISVVQLKTMCSLNVLTSTILNSHLRLGPCSSVTQHCLIATVLAWSSSTPATCLQFRRSSKVAWACWSQMSARRMSASWSETLECLTLASINSGLRANTIRTMSTGSIFVSEWSSKLQVWNLVH